MNETTILETINRSLGQLQVGGKTNIVNVEIVTDTAAYADGDVIGGCYKVDGAIERDLGKKGGIIASLRAQFATAVAADIEVYFFSSSVTATDQAAFAPTAALQKKMIPYANDGGTQSGPVILPVAAKLVLNSVESISLKGLNMPFSNDLYVVVVATSAIDFVGASDLSLQIGILQD